MERNRKLLFRDADPVHFDYAYSIRTQYHGVFYLFVERHYAGYMEIKKCGFLRKGFYVYDVELKPEYQRKGVWGIRFYLAVHKKLKARRATLCSGAPNKAAKKIWEKLTSAGYAKKTKWGWEMI